MAARSPGVAVVSALTGAGLPDLVADIARALGDERRVEVIDLPHGEGRARAWAYAEGIVLGEESGDEATRLTLSWSAQQKRRFETLLTPPPAED